MDSDHQPVVVWVKEREKKAKTRRKVGRKETRIRWSVDKRKKLEEKMREIKIRKEAV